MILIELSISVVTLTSIYLILHDRMILGCKVGVVAQTLWTSLFIYTGQYGLIPVEAVALCMFIHTLWQWRLK